MNTTISIIILTAVINALVTGIIAGIAIYRIQKKIDHSYFQQQTRFVKSFEKMSETLETIYKKFTEFKLGLVRYLFDVVSACESTDEPMVINTEEKYKHAGKLDDFNDYFMQNRLYLPSDISEKLQKIVYVELMLLGLIEHAANIHNDENLRSSAFVVNNVIELLNLSIEKISPDKTNGIFLLNQIIKETNLQGEVLEDIYKSLITAKD